MGNDSQLNIAINLVATGNGGKITQEQMEALQKAAQDLGPAGQQAFDALEKLGKTTGANDTVNDLRQAAQAARELGQTLKANSELSNTGKGLATQPGEFAMVEKQVQLTRQQAEAVERLSASLQKQITYKKALGQAHNEEAAAYQKLQAALAPARAETDRQSTVLDALKKNQVEETAETVKATAKKIDYKDALKGLALELPHVGQALRLLISPFSLLGAAASVGIAQIMSVLDHIEEMQERTRVFETRNSRIDPMSVIRENMGRDRDGIRGQGSALNELGRELQQNNSLLGLRMELLGKNAEAKLANDLEAIAGREARGEIKLAEAIRLRAAAQREARESAEVAGLTALQKEAANESLTSSRAAFRASKAGDAANALTPQIEKQIEVSQKADLDVGDVASANGAKRKNLEAQRQWLMEAVSSPNIAKIDFLRYAKLRADSGLEMAPFQKVWNREGAEKELGRVESDLGTMNTQEASTKKVAAQEARKLAQLKAAQASKDAEVERNRSLSDQADERAKDLRLRFEQQDAGRIERNPIIRRTEDMRMQREINEAEKQEAEKEAREKARQKRNEGGGDSASVNTLRQQGTNGGASAGEVDLSPLAVLAQSNADLNVALMTTVQRMIASNQRTAADLRSQVRDNQT